MKKIILILNSEGIKYIIFGVLTTLINIISYLFLNKLGIQYVISNTIAFILSILFAFITNKIYVFKSRTWNFKLITREIIAFLGSRLATFIVDTVLLMLLVEIMIMNDFIAKCIVNIIVIILNYVLSKFIVFKK
ncbi:GtrA family protein [Clostridium weizhouense]|uniref:GtrA family protein n=1 Tax=Clostridium weizhouense TaxID=2859781 RepID=A0ABS7ANL8_9CLOT|nr:GtrA family protein [Clostridium weizhouense]MBW6410270.1 GtrA family protein [Clostridium weizhouense]